MMMMMMIYKRGITFTGMWKVIRFIQYDDDDDDDGGDDDDGI